MRIVPCSILAACLLLASAQEAFAQCHCEGCGCKGGPGWRVGHGPCVSWDRLIAICGDPPGPPCRYEGARQVCSSERRAPPPQGLMDRALPRPPPAGGVRQPQGATGGWGGETADDRQARAEKAPAGEADDCWSRFVAWIWSLF